MAEFVIVAAWTAWGRVICDWILVVAIVFALAMGSKQNGLTALLHACANGHLAIARWLVDEKGIDHCADKTNVSSVRVRSPSRRR